MTHDIHAEEWRTAALYICRICGNTAYVSKINQYLWGCKTCGYTTTAVFIYFKEKANESEMPMQTGDLSS